MIAKKLINNETKMDVKTGIQTKTLTYLTKKVDKITVDDINYIVESFIEDSGDVEELFSNGITVGWDYELIKIDVDSFLQFLEGLDGKDVMINKLIRKFKPYKGYDVYLEEDFEDEKKD
jgi:hypothetical protein